MTRDDEWVGSLGETASEPDIEITFEPDILVLTEDDLVFADDESVDEAGLESFPASDPPSWTSGIDRPARPTPPSSPQ